MEIQVAVTRDILLCTKEVDPESSMDNAFDDGYHGLFSFFFSTIHSGILQNCL